jgi:fatty-acyl-CoA synthase
MIRGQVAQEPIGHRELDGNLVSQKLPTPTDSGIELRRAEFATLTEALDYAATGDSGFNYYSGRGELTTALPYRDMRERARALARRLQGLGRGARVAMVAHTHPDFAVMFYACQYAALVPVPLPAAIHLGGHEAYVRHLRQMVQDCRASAAFAPTDFIALMREAAEGLPVQITGTLEDFAALEDKGELPAPPGLEELAYMQYTSGSTRFPRGTMITQHSALHNLEAIFNHGFRLTQVDRFFSWLPYYHDMGLVGIVLGCMATQRSCDFIGSREFAMRPRLWLKLMSQNRATISFSPPFGYALAARRITPKDTEALDLSAWRVAGVGAEMIHPEWLNAFADALATAGFKPTAFLPSYGMAECALAVSFAPVGGGTSIDYIDGELLSETGEALPLEEGAPSRRKGFINCGAPLPGFEVEIRDENGAVLPDRRVGRLFLRSASVMKGYYNSPDTTAEVLSADGWLNTGDLGYRVEGRLFLTGRAKDLLIINGRNIWPQDLENLAEQQPEVRPTDASAFSVPGSDGTEVAVLVVQCREQDPKSQAELADRLHEAVSVEFGIRCMIELVPPHTLPRTSSGKLSRSVTRKEFLDRHDEERLREAVHIRYLVSDGARRSVAA